jgi:SAM-dependent methyltransferase
VDQGAVFLHGEGDAWFLRNRQHLADEGHGEQDPVVRLLDGAGVRPTAALEVGASNGWRLAALVRRFGCAATAVEPSPLAVRDGEARFSAVRFVRGQAHDLAGLADGSFDLAVVNFVLHWVDRRALLRSVAEIDRVLRDGGWLVVGDFDPPAPQRVRYHHRPDADVWTYKQDYPAIWLASELYEEAASLRFHHATRVVSDGVEPAQRGRVSLLRKVAGGRHRVVELP